MIRSHGKVECPLYCPASNAAVIGTYAYDGASRRQKKVVTNQGPEATPNDGGNTTVAFQYDKKWRIVEDRNGSNQTVRQYVGGIRYVDEYIWIELNGNATIGNDTTPDVPASGEASESPSDQRYFAHFDRNWSLVSLSLYDSGGTTNARIVERRLYRSIYGSDASAYCDDGAGELMQQVHTSTIGATIGHQGLHKDQECNVLDNRHRIYVTAIERYLQRDPRGYVDGTNQYAYARNSPQLFHDPSGLTTCDEALDQACFGVTHPPNPSQCLSLCFGLSTTRDVCSCYESDDRYVGFDARCVCMCMSHTPINDRVRACLACMEEAGVPPSSAHEQCYAAAGADSAVMGLEVCVACGHCARSWYARMLAGACNARPPWIGCNGWDF
jgi:RHS repeat-associated protein